MGFISAPVDLSSPAAIGSTTPNTGAFTTLSANNGTLTANSPAATFTQTWNNAAVTFTGFRASITDTASGSDSLVSDMQVGATSVFSVYKNGWIRTRQASSGANMPYVASSLVIGVDNNIVGRINLGNSVNGFWIYNSSAALVAQFGVNNQSIITGTSGIGIGASDLLLFRDAANILAQRNSTSAQTFRLYNTFTDASNYERGFFRWNTNVLELGTEAAGTGTARSLSFVSASNSYLFTVNSSASNAGANFTNNATNSYVAVFSAAAPNLTSGQQAYFSVGRNAANNNWASFGFTYASNGSISNRFDINFYGTSALFSILAGGNIGIGTTAPSVLLDVNSNTIRLRTARTPASASAAGDQGSICWDDSYIYVCTATNTWKRVAISTWP